MSLNGLPLTLTSVGDNVDVTAVTGGRTLQKRLDGLGIVAGKALRVLQKDTNGQMVVALGEARLALGREMTRRIFVSPTKCQERK